MLATTLLPTLLLALAAFANPTPVLVSRSPVTLSLSRLVNVTSVKNLVQHDQARARALKARGSSDGTARRGLILNEPITNQAVSYVASVEIGSPPTKYQLLVDTGSSNTWVGANTPYAKTSTSHDTGASVSVKYGSGSFSGEEYTDQVSFGFGLTIHSQSIGVASKFEGFDSVDGILGVGPVDLTAGTVSSGSLIPTVTDNLFTQGSLFEHQIGISFEPTAKDSNENGQITWGGTDLLKFLPFITYIPITSTAPANQYWGIDQSIRYGPSTTILSTTAGIVDTGTTLISIATDAFTKYQQATGSKLDATTTLLSLPGSQYSSLKSLYFTTGGTTFELVPNAQIWPRSLNSDIGGTADNIYLVINDLGSPSGQGLDFINGMTFLERFYSVYDSKNKRVGLANTLFTRKEVN